MERINTKGAQWRIWDMHVHTPASYGGDYTTFVTNAGKSQAAVIGINDYCTIEGYEEIRKLGGISEKVLFPVVELRMHNVLITKHRPIGIQFSYSAHIPPNLKLLLAPSEILRKRGKK